MTTAWRHLVRRFAAPQCPEPRPVRGRWLVLAAIGVLLLARQPADYLAPQLNAEEGAIFFQQAYNEGFLSSLFSSESGYYHLTLRLTAGLALLAPLEFAPLVFKIVAFAIQMLPVAYLLADGAAAFVAAAPLRVAAAALYVAGPNSSEIYLNVNNSQWHLTFAACLILLCPRMRGKAGMALDAGVLTLFAFSGPYSLVCAPLALWSLRQARGRGRRGVENLGPLIVVAGAAVQAAYLFSGSRVTGGPPGQTGLSLLETIRILSSQGTLNSLLGMSYTVRHLGAFPLWTHVAAAAALPIAALLAIRLRNGPLLVLFALASVSVATMFLFPLSDPRLWLQPHYGPRYYFFATLAILYTLLAMAERGGWLRWSAAPFLAIALAFGVRGDFRVPPVPDTHWPEQIAAFRTIPEGASFFIPVYPQPSAWGATLVKRGTAQKLTALDRYPRTSQPLVGAVGVAPAEASAAEPMVTIMGAAADVDARAPAGAVFLVVDGRVFPAVTGINSPGFAKRLSSQELSMAGFSRRVPHRELGPGTHRVELFALDHTRTRLLRPGPQQEFTIPPAR